MAGVATSPHVFGVRHLSPAGAWHLRRLLDEVKPKLVLIEGPSDADELIDHVVSRKSKPPIAILAYTTDMPVRTLMYPLASYSPEYQALLWAKENRVEARFCDLPSSVFLALGSDEESDGEDAPDAPEKKEEEKAEDADRVTRSSVYNRIAENAGEPDYETYWERQFEQLSARDSYCRSTYAFGEELRRFDDFGTREGAETLVREAYMRRKIADAVADGMDPDRIVVVTGAFHASVLNGDEAPMTDAEFESLRKRSTKHTLMPYSYLRLSTQSGYGAGNRAPAYFELVWRCMCREDLESLPAIYLSRVVEELRESGTFRSTAEVIEGVRLAETLAGLRDSAPTLRDLQDAAVTLLGQGEPSVVAEPLARVNVGTAIGSLAKGVSQTSIQDDFNRELARLKLDKYKTGVLRDLDLDLRENRRVKSREAAFLDLHRSYFLHRLQVLEIGFGRKEEVSQESATWAERWKLMWKAEAEIAIVEAVLLGETVELATAYKFKQRLGKAVSVSEASAVVREACQCGMPGSIELARQTLQKLASESSSFTALADAAMDLARVIRYGDVRQFDPKPLEPLLEQLFLQGTLALTGAANCDHDAAKKVLVGIGELDKVSVDYSELVDEELWTTELRHLSDADHLNPLLSGYACALLVERSLISDEALAREVSRRLSPGVSADLGAGWFEGLASRNRYALLTRLELWRQLADYVSSLTAEEFKRALVFLRRAFGTFSSQEKRSITENLGEIWGVNEDSVSEALSEDLSEEEKKSIEELNDFDFDEL